MYAIRSYYAIFHIDMSRKLSSIFLTLIFVAFISAPTIISLVDDSIDTSIFYSVTEEEEKICHIKLLLNDQSTNVVDFALINVVITSYSIHYTKLYEFKRW